MNRIGLAALVALGACKSQSAAAPTPAQSQAAAQDPAPTQPAESGWKALVGAPDRSEADRKLDPGRRPAAMLAFLDPKPGMKAVDLGAGPGYTTELLARAVGPAGVVYMQNDPRWLPFLEDSLAERMTHPAMKGVVRSDVPFDDPIPAEARDLDLAVMNVIYHDIVNMPVDRARMNKIVFNALKPGGVYAVVDSSARDGSGLADTRALHRIDEKVVEQEVVAAGFRLAARGDFLRNKEDARDWNASPGAAAQAGKRGQSDRFALKFVRPEGSKAQLVPPGLRLPAGVRPIRVTAELQIDPDREDFQGEEQIDLVSDAPLPLLWLNASSLKIEQTEPPATALDAPPDFVALQFATPLPAGHSTVRIRWQGRISSTDVEGVFRQRENGDWYVLTQGEPLGMRRVLPSFDEPSIKVPYRVSLRVPEADAAFFNTPQESAAKQGGWKTVRFAETRPLPAYLLAFAVGPFERVEAGRTRSGAPLGVVVTRGKTSWARYAAQSSAPLMDRLESYFRIPYAYPKLDSVEVPVAFGAMENPGLVTFDQRINLARPGNDTPSFRRHAAAVEAHEFAHLWFGDLVTTAWWDDIWLNEAFATWMASKLLEQWQPSWGTPADRVEEKERAMDADQLLSARRIRQPIESKGDIRTAFDRITYEKGAAVIAMFEQWVGPEPFRRGVTRHLKAHADGNATAADFLAAVSTEAGKDVAAPFSTFLDQGGAPAVTAHLACDGGKARLELSQARYLPLGSKPPPREQLWQIPVCARTDLGRACTLLTAKTGALELPRCPAWVTANAAAAGYYRTLLDDAALALAAKNLARLTSPERMMHFYDVAAAARAGVADEGRALELVLALAADPDHHVLEALFPALAEVREDGLVSAELMPRYQAFVRAAFEKRAHELGFEEKKGEPESARLLRPQLLAMVGDQGGDQGLRVQGQKLALRWLSDHQAASPELAEAALFLAALDADALLYQRLHEAARAETERLQRIRILKAMGQVRDPELVKQGFQIFLSDEFDPRESIELLWAPSRHHATRDLAVEFTEKSFDAIAARMPRGTFGDPSSLPRLLAHLCDEGQAAQAERFFRPRMAQFPGGDRLLSQSLERVRQCAAFRERQAAATAAFLRGRSGA